MTAQRAPRWYVRALPVALALLLAAGPVWAAIFTDIQGLPTQRAIERLAAKGVFPLPGVRGTPDRFNPTGTVGRAELAVFLFRALGLGASTEPGDSDNCKRAREALRVPPRRAGVTLPDYKDAGDIPREMQSAVANLANLASTSPGRVEIRKGPLTYVLTTDKTVYGPTDAVELRFTVTNTGREDVKLDFATTQLHDFVIRDSGGEEIARWSIAGSFTPLKDPVTVAGGKSLQHSTCWFQLDQNDSPVPPGRYEIVAIQTTKSNPTTLSIAFNKGIMTGFPDNTFRPKQEVTRLELATTTVRAMGLADAAPSSLNVADTNDVPQAARGAVAAALEKRILNIVGNREFRPNQSARRTELAQALDVLMDVLKRYNFARGTLKDPVSGSPAQITIEDERKALRPYRVGRYHAVYLNDRPAELRDLRPGDLLQFLSAGEVGDVVYIEATRR